MVAWGVASYTMDIESGVSSYKGIGIHLRPLQIKRGGWIVDFTLIQVVGSKIVAMPYAATVALPTRELANLAALESAHSIIEQELMHSASYTDAREQEYLAGRDYYSPDESLLRASQL